jgi:hypothetical protein
MSQELLADFPGFMPYRAQRACFGASYVYTILVDIYGIGEHDSEAFMPVDQVKDFSPATTGGEDAAPKKPLELGWALGAAVFSALDLRFEQGAAVSPDGP